MSRIRRTHKLIAAKNAAINSAIRRKTSPAGAQKAKTPARTRNRGMTGVFRPGELPAVASNGREVREGLQPTHLRAFWNARIHGLASPQASGCQLIVTVRCTRSVCGISTVKRPSGVVTEVMPCGEPFGLNG